MPASPRWSTTTRSRSTSTSPTTRSPFIASNRVGEVMLLLALAWRNLWRNTRRTLITLSALSLGTAGIIGMTSYRESTFHQLVQTITTQLVGDIQVHAKGYQAAPSVENGVTSATTIEARIAGALPGASVERR